MSETKRVLLAGAGTSVHRQNHQRDMYLPALQSLEGVEVAGVWAPAGSSDRCTELAIAAGVVVTDDLHTALNGVTAVIACPDLEQPDQLRQLLEQATGIPVLVDKPTLLPTATLQALAQQFPTGVVAAHHPRFHPAVSTARGRTATGGLGLLHAVHGELLVGAGDGPHPLGELRNLAVYALDVVQSLFPFSLHGKAHAVISPPGPDGSGEAITLSLRLQPDVAVTLLVGRTGRGSGESDTGSTASGSVHRYRILGSHGQLLVDLASPAFDLVGDGAGRLPFGPSSVQAMIEAVVRGAAGEPSLRTAAELAAILDVLQTSAQSHTSIDF